MKQSVKSLEDFWYCLFGICIQVYCLYEGFIKLHKYNSQSWQPYKKPDIEICIYAFFLCISILLLPLFVLTALFKIGSYANDNFKFGFDLEFDGKKQQQLTNNDILSIKRQQSRASLNQSQRNIHAKNYITSKSNAALSTSSFTSTLTTISAVNTPPSKSKFNFKNFVSSLVKCLAPKYLWKYFMPISNFIHLIISFCFLYPNVLLVAKEIEYGFRPKGYIHFSELDFLFSRPLKRLGEKHDFNELKFELITSSLDDIEQVNYEPQISIELINYLFAIIAFSLKYSSTLWYLNKFYSIIFSMHIFAYGIVSILTLGAYQILYKFETAFLNGIKVVLTNDTTRKNHLFELPFVTTRTTLNLLFISISLVLLLSCVPIYTLGICQYDLKFRRLKNSFSRFLITNAQNDDYTINNRRHAKKLNPFFSSYRHHIWALLTLVLICVLSAVCVYDFICLYQLTTDTIPLWAAISHIVFILWYLILWLILTFKTKWRFEFSQLFKLSYWQYLNKTQLSPLTISSGSSTSGIGSNQMRLVVDHVDCESVCSRPRRMLPHVSSSLSNLPTNIDGYLEQYEGSIDGSVYENELLMRPVQNFQRNFSLARRHNQSSLRRLAPVLEAINPDSPRHHVDPYETQFRNQMAHPFRRSSVKNHVYESTRKLASHSAENILTAGPSENYDLLDFSIKAAANTETRSTQEESSIINTNNSSKKDSEILPLKLIQKPLKNQSETDSGRHSMTDSPCSIPSNNDNNFKQIKSQPGMFTSKCTLSSGTAITISQTMQKIHNTQNNKDLCNDSNKQQQNQQNDDLLRKSLFNLTNQSNDVSNHNNNTKTQQRSSSRNGMNFSSKIISEL